MLANIKEQWSRYTEKRTSTSENIDRAEEEEEEEEENPMRVDFVTTLGVERNR